MYKYIFIDWAMTLSTSLFWEQFKDMAHPQHHIFEHAQSRLFVPGGFTNWLIPWMRGSMTSEDVMAGICRGTEFDPYFLLQELKFSCQNMRLISEEIPAYVTSLRAKGIKVVIATDNMDTFQRWTVPSLRLQILFDDILSSFELRALKADRSQNGQSLFFGDYLRTHCISRGESLLLDDADEDFGDIMRVIGIDYQHIEPGKGLVPALQALLS